MQQSQRKVSTLFTNLQAQNAHKTAVVLSGDPTAFDGCEVSMIIAKTDYSENTGKVNSENTGKVNSENTGKVNSENTGKIK